MVQFHPTVLWTGPGAEGQQTLISEAVRGEGAVLVDGSGRRIMVGAHPLADLAPRDVVSATIAAHLAAPATSTSGWTRPRSVPTTSPAASPASSAPAARRVRPDPRGGAGGPAAHYVRRRAGDLDGRTSVTGLFAVGEVACTGVHGANRLASNSITEGLVAARRAELLATELPAGGEAVYGAAPTGAIDADARATVTAAMTRFAGVLRDGEGLRRLAGVLAAVPRSAGPTPLDLAHWRPRPCTRSPPW